MHKQENIIHVYIAICMQDKRGTSVIIYNVPSLSSINIFATDSCGNTSALSEVVRDINVFNYWREIVI